MIFLDSNIPMYLVGRDARRKAEVERVLGRLIAEDRKLVTSAEVLQEILHRYGALRLPEAIAPAFEALLGVADEVFPVTLEDALAARTLVLERRGLSARDALHAAVMRRHGVEEVFSFDRGFDRVPGIRRVGG